MRVLSFIPAFLIAAASFVAAAPASTPADTSCVTNPTGGNGNDASLKPVIAIIANATDYIQPLNAKLSALQGDACTPKAVADVVVQINAVVSTCVSQLQATAQVDLSGLDFTNLYATISAHLTLVVEVLTTLVTIVVSLRASAVGTVQAVVSDLLRVVVRLVGCLNVYVVASVSGALGPVIVLVNGSIVLLLSICANLSIAFVN